MTLPTFLYMSLKIYVLYPPTRSRDPLTEIILGSIHAISRERIRPTQAFLPVRYTEFAATGMSESDLRGIQATQ